MNVTPDFEKQQFNIYVTQRYTSNSLNSLSRSKQNYIQKFEISALKQNYKIFYLTSTVI